MEKQKCEHCNYEWVPRVEEPVSCPRCKKRFDIVKKKKEVGGNGLDKV